MNTGIPLLFRKIRHISLNWNLALRRKLSPKSHRTHTHTHTHTHTRARARARARARSLSFVSNGL